jgi:hypothetical protein
MGLRKILIPPLEVATDKVARCPIYSSVESKPVLQFKLPPELASLPSEPVYRQKIIVFVQGSGGARPGMWSRSLCINGGPFGGLRVGSMVGYVEQAKAEGYEVIITNPFANKVNVTKQPSSSSSASERETISVVGSETPANHLQYVWDHYVMPSAASQVFIVANGVGGEMVLRLLECRPEAVNRLTGIAFLDSSHAMVHKDVSMQVKSFLQMRAMNWRISGTDLSGVILKGGDTLGCLSISAGAVSGIPSSDTSNNHTRVCSLAIEPIFRWFKHLSISSSPIDPRAWATTTMFENSEA